MASLLFVDIIKETVKGCVLFLIFYVNVFL